MISREELNPKKHSLTPEQSENQEKLFNAVNIVRAAYGKPMVVTSGVRSWDEHVAIYEKKGIIKRDQFGKMVITRGRSFPTKSSHLSGAAVDFADPKGLLKGWILSNLSILEQAGLYMEDPTATKLWCHLQVTRPGSGNRIFLP